MTFACQILSLAAVNEFWKIHHFNFVLNDLTAFVYTKTIIHLSVGGQWGIFTTTHHLHFSE